MLVILFLAVAADVTARQALDDRPMLQNAVARVAALDHEQGLTRANEKPALANRCERGSSLVPEARFEWFDRLQPP